jgi:hypothetical protein
VRLARALPPPHVAARQLQGAGPATGRGSRLCRHDGPAGSPPPPRPGPRSSGGLEGAAVDHRDRPPARAVESRDRQGARRPRHPPDERRRDPPLRGVVNLRRDPEGLLESRALSATVLRRLLPATASGHGRVRFEEAMRRGTLFLERGRRASVPPCR